MVYENWLNDLPQQFQNKIRIELLISAFSRQLQEVYEVFQDIGIKTDLERAVGVNLDMVGDIVSLNRAEAYKIISASRDEIITDGLYRQALKYQILKNTGDCTYFDIMKSVGYLWDTGPLRYIEDPGHPAMIFINVIGTDIDGTDPLIGKVLIVRAAGVGMLYTVNFKIVVNHSKIEKYEFHKMKMRFHFRWWNQRLLDGCWILDGKYFLDALRPPIQCSVRVKSIKVYNSETFEPQGVQIYKHFWTLNGEQLLDGSKNLGAETWKEDF